MNLSELKSEQTSIILTIDLPVSEKQHLASLGIIQGSSIYILRNTRNASLVIEYRDTFLAISYEIAQHILVEKSHTSSKGRVSS